MPLAFVLSCKERGRDEHDLETERWKDGRNERRRDREMERQKDGETERSRDVEMDRQRERETERQRERDRETERPRQRDRETERRRESAEMGKKLSVHQTLDVNTFVSSKLAHFLLSKKAININKMH